MLSRKVFVSFVAGAALASTAHAQENVGGTQKAQGPLDIISSQSANVQLRNYVDWIHDAEDRGETDTQAVLTQARGNFTVNMFDDVVANTLTLGVGKANDGTQKTVQRRSRFLTEVAVFDSAYFSTTPYLDLHLPQDGAGTRGDLGIAPVLKAPTIDVGIGGLDLSFRVDAEAQFNSQTDDSDVRFKGDDRRANAAYGLAEDEEGNARVEDGKATTYEVMYTPKIALDLDRTVAGLKLTTFVEQTNTYNPVEEIDAEDGSRETVYIPARNTWTYFQVTYGLTESLTFDNFFAVVHGGVYDRRGDNDRITYENLARLSYAVY